MASRKKLRQKSTTTRWFGFLLLLHEYVLTVRHRLDFLQDFRSFQKTAEHSNFQWAD
jgi:hypothetical protein